MPTLDVVIRSPISTTVRARQVQAMFDVPPADEQTLTWQGTVPYDERPWNVGLIVGPSGCGKSTIAKALFGEQFVTPHRWTGASVLDDFPSAVPLETLTAICQAVGFNTIPAWLRPYHVLSNGERFRVDLARTLIESPELAVVDEFTSVVDRQVAKIGAHAVQKYVRRAGSQFFAVSCHYDIAEWLQPDWIFEPATMQFTWREVQRRPPLRCEVAKVGYDVWRLFAPYHYLTAKLHRAASCYVLFVDDQPAAFAGVLYRPHPAVADIWGVSRLVTLPDYQGMGLAFVLTDVLGAAFGALQRRLHTYPAHPALIHAFDRSKVWALEKRPGTYSARSGTSFSGYKFGGRPNAVFSYVGPHMADTTQARRLLGISALISK